MAMSITKARFFLLPARSCTLNLRRLASTLHADQKDPYLGTSSSSDPTGIEWRPRLHLKPWQKVAVGFGSMVGAFLDPARADLVAALGETTGTLAFENMLARMKMSEEGRRILAERPRVISSSVGHAWDMPENTFGAAYARFMGKRNFSPDDRPPVRFMDTEELSYVVTRAREVHDFWHVLFRLPTNLLGESALKIVEFQQTYLPMCFLSVVGGSIRLKPPNRDILLQTYMPWALKAGRACSDLMCIYYEDHFQEDLADVRKKWGIIPAPSLSEIKGNMDKSDVSHFGFGNRSSSTMYTA